MTPEQMDQRTRRELSLAQDYKLVFDSDAGRRVLMDLCTRGFVYGSTFVPGDPHATSHNEGRRSLALRILNQLGLGQSPERYLEEYLSALEARGKEQTDGP